MTDLAKEFAPAGRLRASLNMGNPVLAHSHTAPEKPAGVTIDLAREFARELGVAVDFLQFDTAAKSVAALASGEADIGFMAIDPLRAATTHFTPAYVQIEGYYLVPEGSTIQTNADVDRAGIRIVMGAGSAYGLYLQRHIQHATLVQVPTSEAVVDAMLKDGLDVASGVKQGLEADARRVGGVRLLGERFMVINQAMAMPRARSAAAAAFLDDFVTRMKRGGFVAASLARHAIAGATVADH
ncbi:transporter substrate-binding domain-containing protein [Polaromonas sp. UC242_47]|uniref:transporter substrate-binding domain-containing protein n=1 Tax=Polaromonas sp. UC242_47 TaxID=3374626 RepID=UPI00379577CB